MRNPRPIALAVILLAACLSTTTQSPSSRPVPEEQRRDNSRVAHVLGIPPGQLPRPGQCRVWIQDRPPGRQARARSCAGIVSTAPPGSWIIYRTQADNSVHVHVMDPSRAGRIFVVRHYNANGRWLKDETAEEHEEAEARENRDDRNDRDERGRRRP